MKVSSQPVNVGPIPVSPDAGEAQRDKSKPTKTLPTDRITVSKQLDILRAYAAASANGTRAATVSEVAEIVKMAASTVGLVHPFFTSVNFIQRTGTGAYSVSTEAINFLKAYEWDKDTASHKLGPGLRNSWFGQALLARLTFGSIEEKTAIAVLAEASSAAPEYEDQLRMVIEFMVASGLVLREGGQVRARPALAAPDTVPVQQKADEPEREPSVSATKLNTSVQATPGKFNLNISVEVDMAEFSTWRPERIQAFFRGVAEVLAAKADVEKGGTGA
jgi:hypothetical protein